MVEYKLIIILLVHGKILTTKSSIFLGDSMNLPIKLHDIRTSTEESSLGIGDIVDVGGYTWRIVHIYDNNQKCVLMTESGISSTNFSTGTSTYIGSSIEAACNNFYNNLLYSKFKEQIIPIQVHPSASGQVGQYVWIPQINWISTELRGVNPPGTIDSTFGDDAGAVFDYFTDSDSADSTRICKNNRGDTVTWWTASAETTSNVFIINQDGSVTSSEASNKHYSRMFVACPLSALTEKEDSSEESVLMYKLDLSSQTINVTADSVDHLTKSLVLPFLPKRIAYSYTASFTTTDVDTYVYNADTKYYLKTFDNNTGGYEIYMKLDPLTNRLDFYYRYYKDPDNRKSISMNAVSIVFYGGSGFHISKYSVY